MSEELKELLLQARNKGMSQPELREHRRSFVYGNTNIENDRITREMVEQADNERETQNKSL